MSNLKKYKGFSGSVEVSIDDSCLHGKVECINDLVTYESQTVDGLQQEFEAAIDDYIQTCKELGRDTCLLYTSPSPRDRG